VRKPAHDTLGNASSLDRKVSPALVHGTGRGVWRSPSLPRVRDRAMRVWQSAR